MMLKKHLLIIIILVMVCASSGFASNRLLYSEVYMDRGQYTIQQIWDMIEHRSPYKISIQSQDSSPKKVSLQGGLTSVEYLIRTTKDYYQKQYGVALTSNVSNDSIVFSNQDRKPRSLEVEVVDSQRKAYPPEPAQPKKEVRTPTKPSIDSIDLHLYPSFASNGVGYQGQARVHSLSGYSQLSGFWTDSRMASIDVMEKIGDTTYEKKGEVYTASLGYSYPMTETWLAKVSVNGGADETAMGLNSFADGGLLKDNKLGMEILNGVVGVIHYSKLQNITMVSSASVKIPFSGRDHVMENGKVEPTASVEILKSFDRFGLAGMAGYTHSDDANFYNHLRTTDVSGIFFGGFGVSTQVNGITLSTSYYYAESPLKTGFKSLDDARQEIGLLASGITGEWVRWSIEGAFGLSDSSPDYSIGVNLGLMEF